MNAPYKSGPRTVFTGAAERPEPPVHEPPNEPKEPPVEEPGRPPEGPFPPQRPPVEEPPNAPRKPPVKEPPPGDPNRKPPVPPVRRATGGVTAGGKRPTAWGAAGWGDG